MESDLAVTGEPGGAKHGLVLAYYMPPYESAGYSIRTVKFLKYLPSPAFRFTVITMDSERPLQAPEFQSSRFLLEEVPESVTLIPVSPRLSPPRWCPPGRLGDLWKDVVWALAETLWGRSVYNTAMRIARSSPVDFVYVTAPQYSLLPTALRIKRSLDVPLLTDLRDDWVGGPTYFRKPKFLRAVHRQMERRVISGSDKVVLVTQRSLETYRNRYPRYASKFTFISNGFDSAEFGAAPVRSGGQTSEFTLCSVGANRRRNRSLEALYRAAGRLRRRRPDVASSLRIHLIGGHLAEDFSASELEEFGIADAVSSSPVMEKSALISAFRSANILVCVNSEQDVNAVPGKIYEYWAAERPVLLLDDNADGASRRLTTEYRIGHALGRSDVAGIESFIEQCFDMWLDGKEPKPETDKLYQFDRKYLAQKLMASIRDMIEERTSAR